MILEHSDIILRVRVVGILHDQSLTAIIGNSNGLTKSHGMGRYRIGSWKITPLWDANADGYQFFTFSLE